MPSRNLVRVAVTVRIGERVVEIKDAAPLTLSGDQRRWRSQVTEHVNSQLSSILSALGERFKGGLDG